MKDQNSIKRFSRQQDIVPNERLSALKVIVVGVGAIGRQVALQLTAVGISWLQLIDPDVVEESNLASQGYLQNDLGQAKVFATGSLCHDLNPMLELHTSKERFRRSMVIGNAIFVCVDSIDTRRFIWNTVKDNVDFLCDGRMSAETMRILSVYDQDSYTWYPETLFAQDDAYVGVPVQPDQPFTAEILLLD